MGGQHDKSKLVKITEYVEGTNDCRRSYIVFKCDKGNTFVTEKLETSKATWEVNPAGLEARNALAKVVRSSEDIATDITVRSMKNLQAIHNAQPQHQASSSECKRYAQAAFSHAIGAQKGDIYTGFVKKED